MRRSQTAHQTIDLLKSYFSKIQIADKDRDLDRDPHTSTSWDGDSFSNGATGTINWVTDFGLPEIPKLVWLMVQVRDSASTGGDYGIMFKAKSTTTNTSLIARSERAANSSLRSTHGPVAVADDGTTYYSVTASGPNTMDIHIRVVTWVK